MMAIQGRPGRYSHYFKQKEQRKQINSSKSMIKVQNMALRAKNKYTPYAVTQYHGVTAVSHCLCNE